VRFQERHKSNIHPALERTLGVQTGQLT